MAVNATNEEAKEQLLQMAQTWADLAKNREEQLAREKRIAALESNGN